MLETKEQIRTELINELIEWNDKDSIMVETHLRIDKKLRSMLPTETPEKIVERKAVDLVEFLEWFSDNRWVRRDATHPKHVGKYWSDVHCVYQTSEELIELFEAFIKSVDKNKNEAERKAEEILLKNLWLKGSDNYLELKQMLIDIQLTDIKSKR